MKTLYIFLHIAAFIVGWLDGGNISVFMMLVVIDICILLDKVFGPSTMIDEICNYIRR